MISVPTLELLFKIDGAFQFRDFHSNHGEPVSRAVSQLDRSQLEFIAKLYEYRHPHNSIAKRNRTLLKGVASPH